MIIINYPSIYTTCFRFMRLYVSKRGFKGKNLTNLKLIVEFIVGVYYPLWFEAKVKHSFIEGPKVSAQAVGAGQASK